MAISRGLPSKTLEELLSELEIGPQTSGEPGPTPAEEINQAARNLPAAGEFLASDFSAALEADWVPIEVDPQE